MSRRDTFNPVAQEIPFDGEFDNVQEGLTSALLNGDQFFEYELIIPLDQTAYVPRKTFLSIITNIIKKIDKFFFYREITIEIDEKLGILNNNQVEILHEFRTP